jgi:hypothetical protein
MTDNSEPAGEPGVAAGIKGSHGVKDKALHQAKQFLFIFLYLFVLLVVFAMDRAIVLEQHNLGFTDYGFALVNALVLGKVILVAEDFHLGRGFEGRPLVYPVLFKSLLFAVVLIGFHILESILKGWWHDRTLLESISWIGGGGIKGILFLGFMMFVVLIPFFAFRELDRLLGSAVLRTLLFERGTNDLVIEVRHRSQEQS